MMLPRGWKRWLLIGGTGFVIAVLAAAYIWRDDILRTGLDPKQPFQVYAPPSAPDYAAPAAWALLPSAQQLTSDGRLLDVFFVHPTTFDGGDEWSGAIDDPQTARQLQRVMLPNYAGPFYRVGRVYAPRYRQAGLYAYLTRKEDALEARRFAYGDVERAFRHYVSRHNAGRPFIIVGVEQGGFLADRLVRDVVGPDPALRQRMVAAYLTRVLVPAARYRSDAAIPACRAAQQTRCAVAYATSPENSVEVARNLIGRATMWGDGDRVVDLEGAALCVNPLGAVKPNLGSANATGVPWGARPQLLPGQVTAYCREGLLQVSRPKSKLLRARGGWTDRLKAPGYNLFFADLEADAMARAAAYLGRDSFPLPVEPITRSLPVGPAPTHRID